ncbi:MAG TPA: NUDIX domain-containing protein [Actinomycetota bacterium]
MTSARHAGEPPRGPRSAGLLLWRRAGDGIEVLLGHPGGPYFATADDGAWTVMKGEPEEGEDLFARARIEFEEETGSPPPEGPAIELGWIRQKGGKVVVAWALEGDLDPASAVSTTFELEWPPRSGRRRAFPEIDRVAWFRPDEARRKLRAAQAPFVDRLEGALGGRAPA